jgi:hypothetical protein
MELLLSHQTQFVNIYSQIHRHTDPPAFMKSLQNLIVSLRKTIMTSQSPSVQKAHFTILKLLFKQIAFKCFSRRHSLDILSGSEVALVVYTHRF